LCLLFLLAASDDVAPFMTNTVIKMKNGKKREKEEQTQRGGFGTGCR
jgi:hypothetical protein